MMISDFLTKFPRIQILHHLLNSLILLCMACFIVFLLDMFPASVSERETPSYFQALFSSSWPSVCQHPLGMYSLIDPSLPLTSPLPLPIICPLAECYTNMLSYIVHFKYSPVDLKATI